MKESLNLSKMIKLKPNWTTRRIHVSKHVILNLRIGLFDNQFGNIHSFAPSQDFIPTFNEGLPNHKPVQVMWQYSPSRSPDPHAMAAYH